VRVRVRVTVTVTVTFTVTVTVAVRVRVSHLLLVVEGAEVSPVHGVPRRGQVVKRDHAHAVLARHLTGDPVEEEG